MEDHVLKFAVVLMFAVSIHARPFCKDINQTERYNIKGEIICCYTAVCLEGHKFLLCKEDGDSDSCQKCPAGFTHGDIINTKDFNVQIDPCELEIKCEDYGADHAVINGVCSCDRFHGFYGHDINMCQIDQGNCKMAGYELAVNGSCLQCDHDHFKEKDGEYGLCREKTRCSADQEIDYPGSISSDRTCKTRITRHTEQPSILTHTNETISSKNKTFTSSINTNSTMSKNISSSSKVEEKTIVVPGNKNPEITTQLNKKENNDSDNSFMVLTCSFAVVIFGMAVILVVCFCRKKKCLDSNSFACINYTKNVQLHSPGGDNVQIGDNCRMITGTNKNSDSSRSLMSCSDEHAEEEI